MPLTSVPHLSTISYIIITQGILFKSFLVNKSTSLSLSSVAFRSRLVIIGKRQNGNISRRFCDSHAVCVIQINNGRFPDVNAISSIKISTYFVVFLLRFCYRYNSNLQYHCEYYLCNLRYLCELIKFISIRKAKLCCKKSVKKKYRKRRIIAIIKSEIFCVIPFR